MASKGFPNPVDVHVGNRIRLRRTLLGLSQEALAQQMGISFQQVQKYERGTNRATGSRLFDLSRVLDVPIAFFFDQMADEVEAQSPSQLNGSKPRRVDAQPDTAIKRETLELVRAYYGIKDEAVRQRLIGVVRAVAAMETD
jgi:transcriptional regulator with XRE-family HTH domain